MYARVGQDQLSKIDEPEGAMQRRGTSFESLWHEMVSRSFEHIARQKKKEDMSEKHAQDLRNELPKFSEEKVDQMRK